MKSLVLTFAILSLFFTGFSQDITNHNVSLNGSKWEKIDSKQMTDTVNLNQSGNEQWEYLMFYSNIQDEKVIDSMVDSSNSINDLISSFGNIELDIASMSASNKIEPLSGFYYSIQKNRYPGENTVVIEVIYPRKDRY